MVRLQPFADTVVHLQPFAAVRSAACQKGAYDIPGVSIFATKAVCLFGGCLTICLFHCTGSCRTLLV